MSPRRRSDVTFMEYASEEILVNFERMKTSPRKGDEMWLKHLNYRQLQTLAKCNDFPSNLKKAMLKAILRARICNRMELVEFYLSQVRSERIRRKKMRQAQSLEVERAGENLYEFNRKWNINRGNINRATQAHRIFLDNISDSNTMRGGNRQNRENLDMTPMDKTNGILMPGEGMKQTLEGNDREISDIIMNVNQQRSTVIVAPPTKTRSKFGEIAAKNQAIEMKIMPVMGTAGHIEMVKIDVETSEIQRPGDISISSAETDHGQICRPPRPVPPCPVVEVHSQQIVNREPQDLGESKLRTLLKRSLKNNHAQVTMTHMSQTQSDYNGTSCFTASSLEAKYENCSCNEPNYQSNGDVRSSYAVAPEFTYDMVRQNQYQTWLQRWHSSGYPNSANAPSHNMASEEGSTQDDYNYSNMAFVHQNWSGYSQSSGQVPNYVSTIVPYMYAPSQSHNHATSMATAYPTQTFPEYHNYASPGPQMCSAGPYVPCNNNVAPTTALVCSAASQQSCNFPAAMEAACPAVSNAPQCYSNTASIMIDVYPNSSLSSEHRSNTPLIMPTLDPPPLLNRYQTNSPRVWNQEIKEESRPSTTGNGYATSRLPSFETFNNRRTSETIEADPRQTSLQQYPLQCLVDAASSVEQEQSEHMSTRNSSSYNEDTTPDNGIIATVKSEAKDVPTWSNYLDQVTNGTHPTSKQSINKFTMQCRFGCTLTGSCKVTLRGHEQDCLLQPFNCPTIGCQWASQLRTLASHVFNVHYAEVIPSSSADFTLDLSHERMFSSTAKPKRYTYLQLVNTRLFFIFIIVDFQAMQIFIYIQYLNDYRSGEPAAALDVHRKDGMLYQWMGRVYPLSYRALSLHTQRKCLVFNFDPRNLQDNVYVIRTTIRAHSSTAESSDV